MGHDPADNSRESTERPVLRVVRGAPSDEEVAALLAVLLLRQGTAGGDADTAVPSRWRDRAALIHAPLAPGAGAWRGSGLPRRR